jgi:hypothetical protein
MMREQEVKNFYRLLRDANRLEVQLRKRAASLNQSRLKRMWKGLTILVVLGSLIYASVLGLSFIEIGLFFFLAFYVGVIAFPFILTWVYRRSIIEAINDPLSCFLNDARITSIVNVRILPKLMEIPSEHLRFLLLALKAEKESFEKRLILVCGPIDKVGFIPGIFSTSYGLLQSGSKESEWLVVLAYSVSTIYLIYFVSSFFVIRLNKNISLVEHAISKKLLSD